MATDQLRLNLGAGNCPIPGYVNLDIKTGTSIDALPYDDGTVDEIRASHVLEHVSYTRTVEVVKHWFAKLKPGGIVKIAVPDFDWIIEAYNNGSDPQVEQYIVGGQVDGDDLHRAIFNWRKMTDLLGYLGFDEIGKFTPDAPDTCQHPCSLNVMARKPEYRLDKLPNVEMLLSVPRTGFTIPMSGMVAVARELGCPTHIGQGAFWGQVLERLMTERLQDPNVEWILTVDYDSVITVGDVRRLYATAMRTGADAVAPLQCKREASFSMLTVENDDGSLKQRLDRTQLTSETVRVASAHFGCTLLRADCLRKLSHPWFWGQPNAEGKWEDGRLDDDTYFWKKWREAGNTIHVAHRVKIGHLQQVITWPDQNWGAVHQYCNDYAELGKPAWAR